MHDKIILSIAPIVLFLCALVQGGLTGCSYVKENGSGCRVCCSKLKYFEDWNFYADGQKMTEATTFKKYCKFFSSNLKLGLNSEFCYEVVNFTTRHETSDAASKAEAESNEFLVGHGKTEMTKCQATNGATMPSPWTMLPWLPAFWFIMKFLF